MLAYYLINNDKFEYQNLNLDEIVKFKYNSVKPNLEVTINESYIENYWRENISSISALIGRNGSGKSSILELIRDRFFFGTALTSNKYEIDQKIILVLKKNNTYEVHYTDNLFCTNSIRINGEKYLHDNEVQEIELPIGINLKLKKILHKPNIRKTRLANDFALVSFNNNWNYTKRLRSLDTDANTKGFSYFNFSTDNLIDKVIRKKIHMPSRIANPEDSFDITFDERFSIDYLSEKKIDEIYEILRYMVVEQNRNFISKYLNIPSHMYVYCDYMESERRVSNFLFEDEKLLLRYEKVDTLYKVEQYIYKKLYVKDTNNYIIPLQNNILLRVLESLFTDVEFLIPNKSMQESIKNLERDNFDDFDDFNDVYELIDILVDDFKKNIIEGITLYETKENEVKCNKDKLISRVETLLFGYKRFFHLLIDFLVVNVDETTVVKVTELKELKVGNSSINEISIQVPVIRLDEDGILKILNFIEEFKKIGTKNNIFYFEWHNLSSGETSLLNLLARLNNVIKQINKKELLIFLDEVELSLHPEWQRQYIKILVENVSELAKKNNKLVQLILTTHSPIITSDIPHYAINYLSKVEGKHNITQNEKQTLGNNIHEVYIDSFYLDSTIGDFAKEKINSIIDKLNSKESLTNNEVEKFKRFINLIGDSLIKQVLEDMLLKKILRSKESSNRIDELKNMREYLTLQIENIERGLGKDE
ncbi:AAA family ATPase [Lysinibacillus fusiformis]|uniref:AAA family ATPase n=1 Tax=Lysinibacillus fusiformis TaxID=28031 RepID=UPI001785CEFD|nr:AAA family ATPase [Lysinibacillus fusiformis]